MHEIIEHTKAITRPSSHQIRMHDSPDQMLQTFWHKDKNSM